MTKEVLLNKKLHLIIDDRPGMSIQELQNKCKKYKDKYGIRLIIIDYLQLLEPAYKSHSRQEEQTNIIRDLKRLANELNIPIIIFSNLSRAALYRHVPILSDLYFLINHVINYIDEIIFMLDHEDNRLNKELIVIQKNGLLGRVKLKWLPEYLKYIY